MKFATLRRSIYALPLVLVAVAFLISLGGDAAASTITDIGTTATNARSVSLQLDASGNPVVSFSDYAARDLTVVHCDDPACAPGGNSTISPDTAGDVGAASSLVLDSIGNPVIVYDDASTGLKLMHCNDHILRGRW